MVLVVVVVVVVVDVHFNNSLGTVPKTIFIFLGTCECSLLFTTVWAISWQLLDSPISNTLFYITLSPFMKMVYSQWRHQVQCPSD